MQTRISKALVALALSAATLTTAGLSTTPALAAPGGNSGFATVLDAPLTLAPGVVSFVSQHDEQLTSGVRHTTARIQSPAGQADAHILTIDLRNPHVRTDLLTAPHVAETEGVDQMVRDSGALVGVNADFFNFFEDAAHAGVAPTGAADGPELRDGKLIKSAVPVRQRFGETAPRPNDGTEVIGVTHNRTGVVGRVGFQGTITAPAAFADVAGGVVALNGLNQFGLGRGAIEAFNADWGPKSRQRAACGDETLRTKPCVTDVAEVIVENGVVVSTSATIGSGQLERHQIALVGREAGAARLRQLNVGDAVDVAWQPVPSADYRWAVGGFQILQAGKALAPLDPRFMPRTSAGVSADGRFLYLITVDGRRSDEAGISIKDMADFQRQVGANDAVVLDGGGSTTIAGVRPGDTDVTVWNRYSDPTVRKVANGIGVFTK